MSGESTNQEHAGKAGKWFLCLIGSSILAMGLLFGWLLLRSYQNAAATRDWHEVEAVISPYAKLALAPSVS